MTLMADRHAVVYARFSSEKQSDRSIEDQVELCRAFCEREGLRVVGVYDDRAISGASTVNRAGWLKLMRDSTNGKFDVVVAESLDRISRDQEDLAGIYKRLRFKQIEIWTVQDGRAGEIHVGVKGLLGALYLKDLAQKTKRGQAGVIRDGRHNGGRSYGYRRVAGKAGVLEIQHDEAAIVRRIFDNYAKGWSPRDIAAELNREAIPGREVDHGTRQRSVVAVSVLTAFCKTRSMSGALYGTGSLSSRIPKPVGASVGQMRCPNG
jgi:site-specific DNA recombinase